jgi:Arabinose efflux permease
MQQGLKENWQQFTVLIIINAFVGGMVGLERSIFPDLANFKFGISGHTAILSFIITFGLVKSIANYVAGKYARTFSRKKILVTGWLFGLPVPFLLIFASSWDMILLANVFLGLNQGLAWSTTVLMKIDLVGEKNRGFAMGLNEFAGYLAVSIFAFLSSWVAVEYGVHPYPFYIGIILVFLGLFFSVFIVRDTTAISKLEKATPLHSTAKNIFRDTSWAHRNLSSVTQAGFVNNLNDAMAWGIIPVWMNHEGYTLSDIGLVAAVYPALWGIGQLFSGKLADLFCKKDVLKYGMYFQALAIFLFPFMNSLVGLLTVSAVLGIGTALVYPTFLSSIAENTSVQNRPESLGVFRFWRDFGYVVGGLLVGLTSDWIGITFSIELVALITLISAIIISVRMYCPTPVVSTSCAQA